MPRNPGKARKRWGGPSKFQNVPGIFTALKCQDVQGKARAAPAVKDSKYQGFGHCWPRQG